MSSSKSFGNGPKQRQARLILNGVDDENYRDGEAVVPNSSRPSSDILSTTTARERYQTSTIASSSRLDGTSGHTSAGRPESSGRAFVDDNDIRPADQHNVESTPKVEMEDIPTPPRPSTTSGRSARSSSNPNAPHVDPATVPVRTSSSKAVGGASEGIMAILHGRNVHGKSNSMASVPEAENYQDMGDERAWMTSNSKQNRHTIAAPIDMSRLPELPSVHRSTSMGTGTVGGSEPSQNIGADLISGNPRTWSPEKENILKGPFDYLESHPGKDIRAQLISAFNAWLMVPAHSLRIISGIVTMLHTASLLIDDVEDNSQLRRGVPVAHSIFGTAQTINSANYIYFCALQEVLKLNNPEAIEVYTEELLNLHRGQGMDLFWRDTLTCPSEDDYLEMVGNKTGGLFRLAIKLMCAESGSPQTSSVGASTTAATYVPLVNTIGLLFQILDDYRNLSDTTYTANKGLCEDLTEGKFSFPIIHAIRAAPTNLVLINILKQKTTDDEVKRYAVAYMDRCGSFSYTRRVLRGLTKKALQLVDEVDAGRGQAEGIRNVLEHLRVDKGSRASQGG